MRIKEEFNLDDDKIDTMLADRFYNYTFMYDEMTRLATNNFLKFVGRHLDDKISEEEGDSTSEDKSLKLVFMSAHDSSLSAILAGVEQKRKIQPFYASSIMIELWQSDHTDASSPDDFYVKFIYNDEPLNIGGVCDQNGKCPFSPFRQFLRNREYKGDWEEGCKNPDEGSHSKLIGIMTLVISGASFITLGVFGYLLIKRLGTGGASFEPMIES